VVALSTALSGTGCAKGAADGKGESEDAGPSAVVFRDDAGRVLIQKDLEGASGKLRWELEAEHAAPPPARVLHDKARQAAGRKDFEQALVLFKEAQALAPDWVSPSYYAAYTRMLQGDTARAEELYAWVDQKEPRGFLATKPTLDCLHRERAGSLAAGFCKAFAAVEFMDDSKKKKSMLVALTSEVPGYPPAWEKLASMLENPARKMEAIQKGLAHDPDAETRGLLLLQKAVALDEQGDRAQAVRILGTLALDPQSTRSTEMLAKATLAQLRARRQ
jgi:tetratricopeptide (TPR) repeat protein